MEELHGLGGGICGDRIAEADAEETEKQQAVEDGGGGHEAAALSLQQERLKACSSEKRADALDQELEEELEEIQKYQREH